MTNSLSDVQGMLKRLNTTVVRNYAYSDIRYALEHTETNKYSLNELDIMDKPNHIKRTVVMTNLNNMYWILYAMCNVLDNLDYCNGHYDAFNHRTNKIKKEVLEKW